MRCLLIFFIILAVGQSPCGAETQQCLAFGSEQSIYGRMLARHIYKTMMAGFGLECLLVCRKDERCQSFNFVISLHMCEFSDRTKEARPEDFISDPDRYYFRRDINRVPLGSVPELAAESCNEIKASEGEVASGKYWMSPIKPDKAIPPYCDEKTKESCDAITRTNFSASNGILRKFQVFCDMTGQGWTLVARFSNSDAKNWMEDSGTWWYDKVVAVGGTTDPSNNTDMISPAFWLVSGHDLKITRSDDPQHTPLLQTSHNCLGGKTFRSKITIYGNFRNGAVWASDRCQGSCYVQYSGQYNTTEGFQQATCDGNIQGRNRIGFWCDWSTGDGAVMMIGGGGDDCSRADHGIGITEANAASFSFGKLGRYPEDMEADFGNSIPHSIRSSPAKLYSLNLWVK